MGRRGPTWLAKMLGLGLGSGSGDCFHGARRMPYIYRTGPERSYRADQANGPVKAGLAEWAQTRAAIVHPNFNIKIKTFENNPNTIISAADFTL